MAKQNNFHQPDPSKQGNGDGNDAAEVGAGTGDMLKSVYDSNDDGRVDSADYAEEANTAQQLAGNTGLEVYYGTDSSGNPGFFPLPFISGTFLGASDTPDDYTGQAGQLIAVNSAEDGVEFINSPVGGGGGQELTTLTKAATGELPNWAAWVADASGGTLSRAMPSSPSDGEEVTVHDVTGNAAANSITVTVTGPTTITQPTLNLNNQSKKWRYDATGDNWDLVFNNAPSASGGGGSFTTNTKAHSSNDATPGFSGSAYASKGAIYTVNSAINLRSVAMSYDVSTASSNTFTFTVAKVSGANSTIDEIVFQEAVVAPWLGTSSKFDTLIVAMDLDLDASQDYAFILTLDSGIPTTINRISFPASTPLSNTELTYVGGVRYASSLPQVGDDTFYTNTTVPQMAWAYS